MKHSESLAMIAPAMALVEANLRAAGKTGHNKFDGYDYSQESDIIIALTDQMTANGLSSIMSVKEVSYLDTRLNSKGNNEYPVHVNCELMILHSSGEYIVVNCAGTGQDRMDKGIYKALTGAHKYGLAKAFRLVTGDDAEADGKTAPVRTTIPEPITTQVPLKEVEPLVDELRTLKDWIRANAIDYCGGDKKQAAQCVVEWSGVVAPKGKSPIEVLTLEQARIVKAKIEDMRKLTSQSGLPGVE